MNIWLMNHYATTMYFDKAGRHYWFAKRLEALGHSVTVFCASTILNKIETVDTGNKRWIIKQDGNTNFIFVKCPPSVGNGIDRIKNMVTFYLNLKPVCREYAKQTRLPDVIVASSVHPLTMIAGIEIAKKMNIPCICEIRDLWPEAIFTFGKTNENTLIGRALTVGEHWIYKNADALIFTKEGDTDYLKEKKWTTAQGGDIDLMKCHYINNGVNLAAYKEQIETEVLDDSDLRDSSVFNVVYAGTIRPVNNVGNLLDCAKIISAKSGYEDIQFLIFGEGVELEPLKERVTDERIENVKLKGFVERRYIPYILSKSSVNILNYSQNEYNWSRGNSSNKLFEYMASGKPVISTVKMGYSIIEKYQCGIEIEECTPECLAEAIIKLHDMPLDKSEEFGRNAYEGSKDFDFNILTEKLMAVIRSVIKQ
ncbi:glycosyltransferase family 4 protein [Holdemania massiliensis]|uniref:glycosyltransferase family 4 protein n=1 Tax=Holdemania massiliensis TaxID=1468449 RepID=UPI0002EE649B|nr:glycosyltransferase family 4 protein [Holdemania massiliensis]